MGQSADRQWPPVPGDFIVGDPGHPVAICTLGKKIDVDCEYAIIGTCKTENIGIERVIVNIVSNPRVRYLILAGPEVPGHRTGQSLKSLYENGVDSKTRRIVGAEGAIPFIENVPLEAVERFRQQVQLVNMLNITDPSRIADTAAELARKDPGEFPDGPMWVDFGTHQGATRVLTPGGAVAIVPELGIALDPWTSLVSSRDAMVIVSVHPSTVVAELQEQDGGHVIVVREV